jgi:hypothetical protein
LRCGSPAASPITLRGDSDHPGGSYRLDRANQGRILQVDPGSAATVEHLVMWRGYVTSDFGGAIQAYDADLELRDVTLLTNVAEGGAGLYWEASGTGASARRLAVENVEFVDGLATGALGSGAGAMVVANGDSDVRLADVRLYLNLATNTAGNDGYGGGLSLRTRGHELSRDSPATDSGNATFATVGPWDVRHGRRVVGPAPDLGAFERGSLFAWDAEEGDTVAWSGRVRVVP